MPELIQTLMTEASTVSSDANLVATLRQQEKAARIAARAAKAQAIIDVDAGYAVVAQELLDETFGAAASGYRLGTSPQEIIKFSKGQFLLATHYWLFPVYQGEATTTRVAITVLNGFEFFIDGPAAYFSTYRHLFNRELSPAKAAQRLQR